MAKLKGLGRGLDALLGGDEPTAKPTATQSDTPRELAVDQLQPGKYQPRTRMAQDALKELAESIKTQGVIQPILVRPVGDGKYEIIAGERRWRASRMAGLPAVPVVIRDIPDNQALAIALIENIQREDLNPLEQAIGIQRLTNEFGLTHQSAADALGRSRTAVTNLLRLLDLAPPVRDLLANGKLDMGHARALLALPVLRQIELANEIAAKGMTVRDVEKRVGDLVSRPKPRVPRSVDRDVARLQEELAQKLGTHVQIKQKGKGRGALIVEYSNLDQLDALIERLKR
ncbi:MAG: ParB/RepB/Spo0J family partition protein [Burkholderiales bacterium]